MMKASSARYAPVLRRLHWLMVVLISGLNFASYVLVKVVGAEHGIGVTGLLGGIAGAMIGAWLRSCFFLNFGRTVITRLYCGGTTSSCSSVSSPMRT